MRPQQSTFAEAGFEVYYKPTRREQFLVEMDQCCLAGTLINTAGVTATEVDPNMVNNSAGVRTIVKKLRVLGMGRKTAHTELHEIIDNPSLWKPQRDIDYADSYPLRDTTVLYYWRATYWRRLAS